MFVYKTFMVFRNIVYCVCIAATFLNAKLKSFKITNTSCQLFIDESV